MQIRICRGRVLACLGAIAVLVWSQSIPDEAPLQIGKLLADGNAQQAEAVARRALTSLDQQNPAGNLETARLLDLLAAALEAQAAGAKPVTEVVDRAIAIKSKLLGPEHRAIAASLAILGKQQAGSGDYSGAIATLERALALLEKDPAAPQDDMARVLDALGSALTDAGQYARSKQMLDRALGLSEAGSRSAGEILRHLGGNLWQRGDMPGARVYLERAIAIFERTLGPDHLLTGNAVGDLASVVKLTGNYAEAKPLFERSLRIYELRLGPDHPRLAVPLNNLALCVKELDEFEQARDLLERALGILEKRLGPDNSRTATVLQNLGIVFRESGDFTHSRQAYERALGVQERRLGPDHPLVASVSNSLGELLGDLGDSAGAKPYLARALAIYQQKTAADNPKIPEVMQSLAGVLRQTGDRAAARQLLERAIAIYTKSLGGENPKLVYLLLALGEILFDAGDVAGAQTRYERALAIQENAGAHDNRRTASALDHLATLAAARKDFKQEAQFEQESLQVWSKALGERNTYMAEPLARLSQALGHLGQREAALRAALDSAQIRREHLRLTVRALPERQALMFAAGGNGGLDAALSLAGGDARAVWDELIRDRALVLDEMAARHRAVVTSASAAPLAERLRKARELFARLVVSGPDSKAADSYEARWQRARGAVDSAEQALAAAVTDRRRERDSQSGGYAEMAAALPPHSALVAFVRYRQESGSFYLAFMIRAGDREPATVRLGSAESVEARVAAWRKEIHREAESMGRNVRWNEQEYRKAGLALRKAVWDPLERHLRGAASVFVVPDGALQLVNLNALPWGETAYLAEHGPLLNTLSAERDLVDAPHAGANGGLLALGNPDYQGTVHHGTTSRATTLRGTHSRCSDFASLRFQPLPESAAEVRAIQSIWSAQGDKVTVLSGAEASEANFKKNAAGKRVLHLATHGFFLDGVCRADSARAENPLLRSGLALSGANQRQSAATDEDDGILTAEEVASLNLEGTEWVVLSGCDTGEGEVRAGEGVLGLRRAFHIAGADTLIASLWPVEDEATRQWMTALYQAHFGQRKSTAEAVADATAKQLRARRAKGLSTHPFYWGSFVAVGNWR